MYVHVSNPIGFIGHYAVNNVIDCNDSIRPTYIKINIIVIVRSATERVYILAYLVSFAFLTRAVA